MIVHTHRYKIRLLSILKQVCPISILFFTNEFHNDVISVLKQMYTLHFYKALEWRDGKRIQKSFYKPISESRISLL